MLLPLRFWPYDTSIIDDFIVAVKRVLSACNNRSGGHRPGVTISSTISRHRSERFLLYMSNRGVIRGNRENVIPVCSGRMSACGSARLSWFSIRRYVRGHSSLVPLVARLEMME